MSKRSGVSSDGAPPTSYRERLRATLRDPMYAGLLKVGTVISLIFVIVDPLFLAGAFALRFIPHYPVDVANAVWRMSFVLFGTAWLVSLCTALGAFWMLKLLPGDATTA